jgi:putative zinc finger/helix-turn-helix YgiT family protein
MFTMPEQLQQSRPQPKSKPFPWRCPRCLRVAVSPVTVPYWAKANHDGHFCEVSIPDLRVPKCSACGELVFNHDADEQITQALRAHLRLLTPEQIQEARHKLGLLPSELAERLGVPEEDVCRWESGLVLQSRAMDNLLRLYFALPGVRAVLTGVSQDPCLGLNVNQSNLQN